jgi:excisionase family DNA binding protein
MSAPDQTPRLVLSVEAAAELLSVSRTRIFALIKTGEMQSVRIGRLRRIPAAALAEYVRALARSQTQHLMPRKKRADGTRAPNGASSIYFGNYEQCWVGRVTVGVRDNGKPDR